MVFLINFSSVLIFCISSEIIMKIKSICFLFVPLIIGTSCKKDIFTCGISSISDANGNNYKTVQIGTQCWIQSNLKVSKYRNGDNIPYLIDNGDWVNTSLGAFALYNNIQINDGVFGKMYNHYAVMDNRGLCPTGWHVPSDDDWFVMEHFLGGSATAGGALKSKLEQPSAGGWNSPNVYATNSSGFSALSGGRRDANSGVSVVAGELCFWWSSTLVSVPTNPHSAWNRGFSFNNGIVGRGAEGHKGGHYVRCLKDIFPVVSTASVSGITATSATTGGDVTQDGGAPVAMRGVAYGTSSSPTTSGSSTNDGAGTGVFTSTLTGLTPSNTYYVRAYATNSVGTAYGNEVTFTTSPLAIGSSYAGGIIFYLDSTGQHGLVCAPSDQGAGIWGCAGTDIPNTSIIVGTGATNTAYIMAGCAQRPIAASVCADLVLNGYSDWFLPSIGELSLMYSQLHLQGLGGFGSDWFWSSSQTDASRAWTMAFSNGYVSSFVYKVYNHQVRAVRAF